LGSLYENENHIGTYWALKFKMNKLDYYFRQKELCTDTELKDIKVAYLGGFDIIKIADMHYRTPGSIAYKLKTAGLVDNHTLARGYNEYKNGELYKEIVGTGKLFQKKDKPKSNVDIIQMSIPIKEIVELKSEVESLKKDMKEMLRIINLIYEFESK